MAPFNEDAEKDILMSDINSDDSLGSAIADAILLLKFAAESGKQITPDITQPIFAVSASLAAGSVSASEEAGFYSAYAKLSKQFGNVTADTIRNCSSPQTRRTLAQNRIIALAVTAFIAVVSVVTFVTDRMSLRIVTGIELSGRSAASLRASLTPGQTAKPTTINPKYATAPCDQLIEPVADGERRVQDDQDVLQLAQFAATIRDLHSLALKLNGFVFNWECDPYGPCSRLQPSGEEANRQLQLNPAIVNFTAETLCKIQTMQKIRTFASNVQANYAAVFGGVAAYALPIFYALLGAFAFRLRLFSEKIINRTYRPSYVDSARLITAVIAGAISGLFNPAQGLSLSPLASAFLVGYGVELFFKFLDTLINAFGTGSPTSQAVGK